VFSTEKKTCYNIIYFIHFMSKSEVYNTVLVSANKSVALSLVHSTILTKLNATLVVEMNITEMKCSEVVSALRHLLKSVKHTRIVGTALAFVGYEDITRLDPEQHGLRTQLQDDLIEEIACKRVVFTGERIDVNALLNANDEGTYHYVTRHIHVADGKAYLDSVRLYGVFDVATSGSEMVRYYCKSKISNSRKYKTEGKTAMMDIRYLHLLLQCYFINLMVALCTFPIRAMIAVLEVTSGRSIGTKLAEASDVVRVVVESSPNRDVCTGVLPSMYKGAAIAYRPFESCPSARGISRIVYWRIYSLIMSFITVCWFVAITMLGPAMIVGYYASMVPFVWYVLDTSYEPRWLFYGRCKHIEGLTGYCLRVVLLLLTTLFVLLLSPLIFFVNVITLQ
jgi:hypothetical protein